MARDHHWFIERATCGRERSRTLSGCAAKCTSHESPTSCEHGSSNSRRVIHEERPAREFADSLDAQFLCASESSQCHRQQIRGMRGRGTGGLSRTVAKVSTLYLRSPSMSGRSFVIAITDANTVMNLRVWHVAMRRAGLW